jgi:hypothetical protein
LDGAKLPIEGLIPRLRAQMPLLSCWMPRSQSSMVTLRVRRAPTPSSTRPQSTNPPVPDAPTLKTGDAVNLSIGVGAVRIERRVEALQAARPGQRLFVRSEDGQTLSVRYQSGPQ